MCRAWRMKVLCCGGLGRFFMGFLFCLFYSMLKILWR